MTTSQITYSVATTFKGNESNPYENRAKSMEDGETMFADFTRFPEKDLIEVELIEITEDEVKSLKTWSRE
jgi:hypothetical protein